MADSLPPSPPSGAKGYAIGVAVLQFGDSKLKKMLPNAKEVAEAYKQLAELGKSPKAGTSKFERAMTKLMAKTEASKLVRDELVRRLRVRLIKGDLVAYAKPSKRGRKRLRQLVPAREWAVLPQHLTNHDVTFGAKTYFDVTVYDPASFVSQESALSRPRRGRPSKRKLIVQAYREVRAGWDYAMGLAALADEIRHRVLAMPAVLGMPEASRAKGLGLDAISNAIRARYNADKERANRRKL